MNKLSSGDRFFYFIQLVVLFLFVALLLLGVHAGDLLILFVAVAYAVAILYHWWRWGGVK